MDDKKKKIVIAGAISLVVLVIILVIVINIKKINNVPDISNPIENVVGRIDNVDINAVWVTINTGEKLQLSTLAEGVSFLKETVQEDGVFLDENIALMDVPKDRDVNIQYNKKTNELMMIVVK